MTTLLEERLKEAINKKNNDLTSFTWKGVKTLDESGKYVQNEVKLVDLNNDELVDCYNHCKKMLFNKDVLNPGRYLVLEIISDQKNRCGVELFLRYIEQEHEYSRFSLMNTLTNFITVNKEAFQNTKPLLKDTFSNIPNEFEGLSLSLVIDGCLDRLGKNK